MIELTPLSVSRMGEVEGGVPGVVGGETKAAGRIGPSKMSTHSFTFSLPEVGLGMGLIPGEGCGGGRTLEEVMGNSWACLEMEEE